MQLSRAYRVESTWLTFRGLHYEKRFQLRNSPKLQVPRRRATCNVKLRPIDPANCFARPPRIASLAKDAEHWANANKENHWGHKQITCTAHAYRGRLLCTRFAIFTVVFIRGKLRPSHCYQGNVDRAPANKASISNRSVGGFGPTWCSAFNRVR